MQTERLFNALLSAFNQDAPDDPKNEPQARALTDILAAFAALIAPPAPEVQGVELVADDTPALILEELRGLRADLETFRVCDAIRVTS